MNRWITAGPRRRKEATSPRRFVNLPPPRWRVRSAQLGLRPIDKEADLMLADGFPEHGIDGMRKIVRIMSNGAR